MPTTRVAISDADYLRLIIHGTTAFELLRTGLELDLFERLAASDGLTVTEVAEAIGVQPQPARILLLGLASLQLLEKVGDRYHTSELVNRRLLRSSPTFLGPLVDVQARIINPCMGDLAGAVRKNANVGLRHIDGPGSTLYERITVHPDLQQVFYANMGDASRRSFAQLLECFDFGTVRHVVDVGGGDGTNAVALARRYPELTATVFDQESVTRLAADGIGDPDLLHRVRFHPGDIFTDQFPAGADVILVLHMFEIWSLERNVSLLRRCHAALPAGGACVVYNLACNDDGTGPMMAGLVSPYFLNVASGEGMAYSAQDMREAVDRAGFARVETRPNLGLGHALVVGYK